MGVGWGLQSHFRVQPNNCVEVVLYYVGVVGVVTIIMIIKEKNIIKGNFHLTVRITRTFDTSLLTRPGG